MSKKEKIIKVASKYFSEVGYDKASLEDVAKEVGVSKAAIYYHFKDKFALYEAVLCSRFAELAQIIGKIDESKPIEALREYIESFGKFLVDKPCFSAIFARELADGAMNMPKSCSKQMSLNLQKLSKILQNGEAENLFEKENPFMVQMMIVSPLINYRTTKNLREVVMANLKDVKNIDAGLEDIIPNLASKIIKALKC